MDGLCQHGPRPLLPLIPNMPSFRNTTYVSGALQGVVIFGAAIVATFGGMTCTAVAGDLLRGGYTNSQSGSTAPGSFTPPSLLQARKNAQDVLARTTQAMASLNAMQAAARKLAQGSPANNLGVNPNAPAQTLPNVPNGLGTGGLDPVGGATPLTTGPGYQLPATWTGVGSLTQTTAKSETTVTVNQNKPDAVLYWNTFNIGKATDLDFNQSKTGSSASTSIAFNIVEGNSINPSQILGSMSAQGQVYVINQNGIIFGGASQVNVHTLVASSLPIDSYLITNGLLNNADDQFLFSAIAQPAGTHGSPAFTPPSYHTGADGDVIVDPGAQITAPANAASVGGRVALIGPDVDNEGIISTPDGQTILAAGLQVGFVASSAATLRGLDVYVGSVSDAANPSAGVATNNGMILASQGDAYMVGASVNQMGSIYTTTSVTLNGEVDLLAQYNSGSSGGVANAAPYLPSASGAVTLGPDSVTSVVPEWNSPDATNVGGFTLSSLVNIQGKTIHMEGDSTLLAPSATVNLNAGTWLSQIKGTTPVTTFIDNGGQIYLDPGASIDAAGSTDVQASVDQNIIPVQLLGPELADSPSQRAGLLAGQTIYVDIRNSGQYDGQTWVGTPLIDNVSSFADLVQYTVAELTINGGTVNLNAGGSVVMQAGSQVNVSGGWIDYLGGVVTTSEVISGGHIYPISSATPDLVYQGFNLGTFTVDHPTYGISNTFTDPILDLSHYEASYVNGGNGGAVSIVSPTVALDGQFLGDTAAGARQRSINTSTPNSLMAGSMPAPSTFSLAFEEEQANASFHDYSPTPPTVTFAADSTLPVAAPFTVDGSGDPAALSTARQDEVVLSPDLFTSDGFGVLKLNDADGNVIVPAGISLDAGPGGGVMISAANLNIEGSMIAPDGNLSFTVYDYSPFASPTTTPPANADRGHFILGASALLNTAGLIVDDRDGIAGAGTGPLVTNGGTISIDSYSADLSAGSVMDVSGGVEMTANGKPAYGNAGSITIAAGQDPGIASILGGSLTLGSELEGFSGATAGSLSVLAPLIQVGGVASHAGTLLLSPDFFSEGGFGSFTMTGLGEGTGKSFDFIPGVVIAPGTVLEPVVTSLVAMADTNDGAVRLTPTVLTEGIRPAASLTFRAPGVNDVYTGNLLVRGDVVVGAGSRIETDPGKAAGVTLSGNTVAVLGSIVVPGGTIKISGATNSDNLFASGVAAPTVDLGPESLLSTAGATIITPNPLGYHTGIVLNGGNVSVSGNIVAEAGSVINVSGASAILDVTPVQADVNAAPGGSSDAVQNGSFLGMLLVPTEVDSSGGSITLHGSQELFTNATLLGAAGGPSAVGGTLTLQSGLQATEVTAQDINLEVTQSGSTIPAAFYPAGQDAIGHQVVDKHGVVITPMGYVAVDTFNGGGFNSLNLNGTVEFSGPVSITLPGSLSVASGGVIYIEDSAAQTAGAMVPVHLSANYVALGQSFVAPFQPGQASAPFSEPDGGALYFPPTYGTGELTVTANLIDIGNLSLQNIEKANFIANNGDIRGDGTLDVSGQITMQAGQIYPATETDFTIIAYDDQGQVAVAASSKTSDTVTLASAALPAGFGIGSTLLGSTVENINGTSVTLASDANASVTASAEEAFVMPGTGAVKIVGSGERQLPLSAGGVLSIYASDISQGGVLVTPLGQINLGWNGTGTSPVDLITGAGVTARGVAVSNATLPITTTLDLLKGSVTSVSAIDPLTGQALIIPYGTNPTGTAWIDPSGQDITTGGVPQKSISISGLSVKDEAGAVIDIKGGGDLMAYQFSPGIGGNNDVLGSSSAFAIIPGYQAGYAPYDTDAGYSNSSLVPGDRIYLNGSTGLPAGTYTLLPARYALLPGAFLVTPQSGLPAGATQSLPDGGSLVSGYQLRPGETAAPLTTSFEVYSAAARSSLATYVTYSGNTFLAEGAVLNGQAVPRLPKDSGELSFQAINSLSISGAVESSALAGGLGGLVDISSPDNIVITGATQPSTPLSNTLYLDSNVLNSFGAASLLVGGVRSTGADGVTVTVTTDDITVDNSGDPLKSSDIILAANDDITVDQGAEIESSGAASGLQNITLAGNGTILRVSSDPGVTVNRTGVTTGNTAELTIDADAKINGGSVTLDSSGGTYLDPAAVVAGKAVALNSGQVTIELTNPGVGAPMPTATSGLILSGAALQTLFGNAESISLLSYSTIDIYGTGTLGSTASDGEAVLKDFSMSAEAVRGFNSSGGTVTIASQNITLANSADDTGVVTTPGSGGSLILNGSTVKLGANAIAIDQFSTVDVNASAGMIANAATGSLTATGDLNLTTPMITGAAGAKETITTLGALAIATPATASTLPPPTGGLGASLTFVGATITDNSSITARSGAITLHATTGNLTIGNLTAASLDASGVSKSFFDVTKYTSGGEVNLIADQGSNLSVGSGVTIDVSAQSGGGNAGTISISDPTGTLSLAGTLLGQAGAGGQSGSFSLNIGSLPDTTALNGVLNAGGSTQLPNFAQSRTIEVQTGNVAVDGVGTQDVAAANINITADEGSITVTGEIDGSGQTGGTVTVQAAGDVNLNSGAVVTVAAQDYSSAQQGGSVDLEAGSEINGVAGSGSVNINAGSTIDLSVAQAQGQGDLAGTLVLRAPQIGTQANPTGVQVGAIDGTITGASSITVEGYAIFNAGTDGSGGIIDNEEGNVYSNGQAFAGNTGSLTQSGNTYTATGMIGSLVGGNSTLEASIAGGATQLVIEPAAEIVNTDTAVNNGNLTLESTWDLAPYRFGPNNVAGALTLRAANDVVFDFTKSSGGASLTDGFDVTQSSDGLYWDAPLLSTVGAPSWSYRIVAGSNFNSANFAAVQSAAALASLTPITTGVANGSVLVGYGATSLPAEKISADTNTGTSEVAAEYFQTIRTGAGSIQIDAASNVDLLNNLATIYSAGTAAPLPADFVPPFLGYDGDIGPASPNPTYPAQYTEYGGSVSVVAQGEIEHQLEISGQFVADSSLELPDNWLDRQGAIDPATGQFDVEPTSWWTNFSNYFEGVATFGGGNVTLAAGGDIVNVDAAVATNAYMPAGTPSASALVQLGGGDLKVSAGGNISGGVYYVEDGIGTISAGGAITTNSTRATLSSQQKKTEPNLVASPLTWLPTTLFAGAASFDVSAGGDLLLGPVANPFLLPQSYYNGYPNRSFFSTYNAYAANGPVSSVNVESLSGTVTIKDTPDGGSYGSLLSWLNDVDSQYSNPSSTAATAEPWLAVDEAGTAAFSTAAALMPPILRVTAFSGSINVVGGLLLSPSPTGTLDMLAAGSINGVQPNTITNANVTEWASSEINLSDADPQNIPSILSPINGDLFGSDTEGATFLQFNALFSETGSTLGSAGDIQTREALHAAGLLHAGDTDPLHLYADAGDLSGFTLFSGKVSRVIAGGDITDDAFYIQNVSAADISVVAAGEDIIAYDPESALRLDAEQAGNAFLNVTSSTISQPASGYPNTGDIQINGPGTLEVLAGRDLTLGSGQNNSNGTSVGITSVGNARDPYLPDTGAQLVIGAGLGGVADGLSDSPLDISAFVSQMLGGADGSIYFNDLAASEPGLDVTSIDQFKKLSAGEQAWVALDLFYLVLRDAGRDHNNTASPGYGNYTAGYAAIRDLLPSFGSGTGDINVTSKEITTVSGGDINIVDPSGLLTVGVNLAGAQPVAQGIFTDDGGNISIYTRGSVNIGTSRIFTLQGGNIIIWSQTGNIDAGNSSKTVQSAPPTRVVVDPQSGNVQTDLAGLATGGGIGVLATVAGIPPGDVDLIAPAGIIDAGSAGIRATGNLNLAAVQILNASNIQAGGSTSGAPAVSVSAPNLAGLSAASSAAGAGSAAATDQNANQSQQQSGQQTGDSVISVSVIGYGGGDSSDNSVGG
jgi:filamentous hemagglutinin